MALTDEYLEPTEELAPKPVTLDGIIASENVAEMLSDVELGKIGPDAVREWKLDKRSMKPWMDRMQRGIDLACLVKEDKSYPWPNSANVKYPMITTAALQFNAKAYPAIVSADQVVKGKTYGADPTGQKRARADRVAEFQSYYLTSKVEEWDEATDKMLTVLPIVGQCFRKVWFDPVYGRARCRLILPGKFVVNDRIETLDSAPRATEEFSLYPGEIEERKRAGQWRSVDYFAGDGEDTEEPEEFIEQHRRLDLDGDGYTEPYIVTVHCKTERVARIVADFDERDVTYDKGPVEFVPDPTNPGMLMAQHSQGPVLAIRRNSYFVGYSFLPSLDGGYHGTGLGLLLGDISETINSIINMMMDAGHMASLGGGFIGAEFRIKGGAQRFRPGEWKLTQNTGATVRDSVVPMTFPGPDATLFEMLGLLIEAGKDVSAVKDVLTGETQGMANMPATTALALIEQGMAQFTAAYKRIYRSLRKEFKLFAEIIGKTVGDEEYNSFHDLQGQPGPNGEPPQPVMLSCAQEFDMSDMDMCPVADPSSVTKQQEAAKAQMLMEMAQAGLVNPQAASMRMLEAVGIPDIEELAPQPDPMAQKMAELQAQLLEAQAALAMAQAQKAGAEAQTAVMQVPAEQMKAQAAAAKAQADVAKSQSTERVSMAQEQVSLVQAQGEQQKLGIEAMKAELDAAIAAEEIEIKRGELMLKAQKTAAEVRNLNAQAANAPARAEAEIGHIKAQTKAAGKPKAK